MELVIKLSQEQVVFPGERLISERGILVLKFNRSLTRVKTMLHLPFEVEMGGLHLGLAGENGPLVVQLVSGSQTITRRDLIHLRTIAELYHEIKKNNIYASFYSATEELVRGQVWG